MLIDQYKIIFLETPMHALSMNHTIDFIKHRMRKKLFTQHVVINVSKLINMKSDIELKRAVTSCDIINIDGMGIVWGARLLGNKIPERVAGVDLFFKLLELAVRENESVFFLGATEEIIEKCVENIKKNYSNLSIAGWHHGYFGDNEEKVIKIIKNSGASMLFVAISSPTKEIFINKYKNELNLSFAMGVGGTFDIVAGKTKRAPIWVQKCGMEWLYRVLQEPKRLFKRYFITNVKFILCLLKSRLFNPKDLN